jgi:hypothetical protein
MEHRDLLPKIFYWVVNEVDDVDVMGYLARDFVEHELPDIVWLG